MRHIRSRCFPGVVAFLGPLCFPYNYSMLFLEVCLP